MDGGIERSKLTENSPRLLSDREINKNLRFFYGLDFKLDKCFTAECRDPDNRKLQKKREQVQENFFALSSRLNEDIKPFLQRVNLDTEAPAGKIFLYRGTRLGWSPEYNFSNAYWSPFFSVAQSYAEDGDVVVVCVNTSDVRKIQNWDKPGEYQIPDPNTSKDVRIITRNFQVVRKDGSLPEYSIIALLRRMIEHKKSASWKPKVYTELHDDYIKNLNIVKGSE